MGAGRPSAGSGLSAHSRYTDDVCGSSRALLLDLRDAIRDWLARERGLRLKDPLAEPTSTRVARTVLGYRLSRDGTTIGDKARVRFRQRLLAGKVDEASLQSTIAAWMFGS